MGTKKPSPRCRTIGGVVYELTPTERKPPCARGRRASSGRTPPARASAPPARRASAPPAPPAVDPEIIYTYEMTPVGGGYDLIASTRSGTGGGAKVLATYLTRDEAREAAQVARKTGIAPPPKRAGAWETGRFARARRSGVVPSDHRVRERLEAERAHQRREEREDIAREQAGFTGRAPERTPLAAAGRLPRKPTATAAAAAPLKSSERRVLDLVRKRNEAGLLRTFDAMQAELHQIAMDLVKRGVLREHGYGSFYAPEFERDLERLARNKARLAGKPAPSAPSAAADYYVDQAGRSRSGVRVSDYDRRRQKVVPLPPSIDPAAAQRGDRVSVFSYNENDPDHAVIVGLPGDQNKGGGFDVEPSVHFESGAQQGMNRHIRWERMFPGWLDPNVNWKPWKG